MCLYSKNRRPLIANTDIVCHKAVQVRFLKDGNVKFVTPYRYMDITKEIIDLKVIKPELWSSVKDFFKIRRKDKESVIYPNCYIIEEGYIHSYKGQVLTRYSAVDNILYLDCIIPKGCKYYYNDDGIDYASKKIVITNTTQEICDFVKQMLAEHNKKRKKRRKNN